MLSKCFQPAYLSSLFAQLIFSLCVPLGTGGTAVGRWPLTHCMGLAILAFLFPPYSLGCLDGSK